jgi:hypothetical protein
MTRMELPEITLNAPKPSHIVGNLLSIVAGRSGTIVLACFFFGGLGSLL